MTIAVTLWIIGYVFSLGRLSEYAADWRDVVSLVVILAFSWPFFLFMEFTDD